MLHFNDRFAIWSMPFACSWLPMFTSSISAFACLAPFVMDFIASVTWLRRVPPFRSDDGFFDEHGGVLGGLSATLSNTANLISDNGKAHPASPAHAGPTAALRARILAGT
jgi:hypothetical protein